MKIGRLVAAAGLALAAPLSASAEIITTLIAGGNSGSAGGAVYFDIAVGASPISIGRFEVNTLALAGSTIGFEVYTTPTTYVGNTTNLGVWTSQTAGVGTAAGANLPSPIALDNSFILAANTTYGMALVLGPAGGAVASHSYTNGNGTNQFYSDANVSLTLGAASNLPFSGSPFSPRVWNGSIYYTLVPAPASLALLGLGGLLATRRRR